MYMRGFRLGTHNVNSRLDDEVEDQMAPNGWGGNLPQFARAPRAGRRSPRGESIMRIRWRGLELPSRVVRDQRSPTDQYGKFHAEPFERGFGTTVGNSLRRILLFLARGRGRHRTSASRVPTTSSPASPA
jgi:hypothetical protein